MPKRPFIIVACVVAALSVVGQADAAKRKKPAARGDAESAFWGPVENGVPIIMQGYHPPKGGAVDEPRQRADRPVRIPRGSSTYIPPPVPSRDSANSPPAAALIQPTVQPYKPPPINSFGDKVIDAIHAYPLERGLGNNPLNQQEFIRQRANQ